MGSFWGIEVQPGDDGTQFSLPPGSSKLHLTQACLDTGAKRAAKAALRVKSGEGETSIIVCSLKEGSAESAGLNLYFDSGCEFSVDGAAAIHLSGYLLPSEESDEELEAAEDAAINKARQAAIDEIMARQEKLVGQKRKEGGVAPEGEPAAKKQATEGGAVAAAAAGQTQQDGNKQIVLVKESKGAKKGGGRGRGGLPKVVLLADFNAGGGSGGGSQKGVAPSGGAAAAEGANGAAGAGEAAPAVGEVKAEGGDVKPSPAPVPAHDAGAHGGSFDWKAMAAKQGWGGQSGGQGGQQGWGGQAAGQAGGQEGGQVGGANGDQALHSSGGGGGGGGTTHICLYIG